MSVLAWMLYASLVSFLALLAAMSAERAAAAMRRPRRWWWCLGLALSILLPLFDVFGWRWHASVTDLPNAPLLPVTSVPVVVIERVQTQAPWLSIALVAMWGVWSFVHAVRIARSHLVLRRARKEWTHDSIDGVGVFVSHDMGPAAVGVTRGAIVVPRWILTLGSENRRIVVRHEIEHVRAHDTLVMLIARITVAFQPWNVALRYAAYQLRLAIEIDCDARVIARGCNRRSYGHVLLDIAMRAPRQSPLLATLTEPHTHLHARISAMSSREHARPLIAAAYSAIALVAFAAACNSEGGSSPRNHVAQAPNDAVQTQTVKARRDTASVLQLAGVESRTLAQPGDAPVGGEKARSLLVDQPARPLINEKAPIYPSALRTRGVEGEVYVSFVVDTNGTADMRTLKVLKSSHPEFFDAVRATLPEMRFDPARLHGRKVRQLIAQPFTFALSTKDGIPPR